MTILIFCDRCGDPIDEDETEVGMLQLSEVNRAWESEGDCEDLGLLEAKCIAAVRAMMQAPPEPEG